MTYKKIIDKPRATYTNSENSNRFTPISVDGTTFPTLKAAAEANDCSPQTAKWRTQSKNDKWTGWVLLVNKKAPKLTDEELRERKRQTSAKHNKKYKENGHFSEYYARKEEIDDQFRLKNRYKHLIAYSIKSGSQHPDFNLLTGTDVETFRTHLTDQQPDFFENWSMTGWNLDHIIPINNFDLTKMTEALKCFHYKNCQVLTAEANRAKGVN